MKSHKNEITTGILVLATFGFLIAVLIVIGMPGMIKPLNTFRIYYDNANGIRPGAPVLLAGREIGKVTALHSPVALEQRPKDHANYEVSIDVQVAKDAEIYKKVTVHLAQQGLMGQQAIDFVQGEAGSGLAENHTEFIGERVPDIAEAMNEHMVRLTGPDSDLAQTIKNAKTFMHTLNNSEITETIKNVEQLTDTLKKEPWRVLWPNAKAYPGEAKSEAAPPKPVKKGKTHLRPPPSMATVSARHPLAAVQKSPRRTVKMRPLQPLRTSRRYRRRDRRNSTDREIHRWRSSYTCSGSRPRRKHCA